jgi:predicted dehydrogenase
MPHIQIYSNDQALWLDAARRMHRATVEVAAAPTKPSSPADAVVFAGAVQADLAAIRRELEAGRHVLIAAEPCLPSESLVELTVLAAKKHVVLVVENPDRRLTSRLAVKNQLGTALGSPELIRIHRWESHASAATTAPLGLPGSLVAEIEQALWLVGRRPVSVFALEHRGGTAAAGKSTNDDSAGAGRFLQVHLGFCPGMAVIDYNDRLPHIRNEPNDGYRSLSVIGSSGSSQTDDQANAQLVYRGGAPRALAVGEGVLHLGRMLDDFVKRIAERKLPGLSESLCVLEWCDVDDIVAAVQSSLSTREAVELPAMGERKVD